MARAAALREKKEQVEGQGGEERKMRRTERCLEVTQRSIKSAGGESLGNLHTGLKKEGALVKKLQSKWAHENEEVDEACRQLEESKRKLELATQCRDDTAAQLQQAKNRHAYLATELAGESQKEAAALPATLETALHTVARARDNGIRSVAEEGRDQQLELSLGIVLDYVQHLVIPQHVLDGQKNLDYLSNDSSSEVTGRASSDDEDGTAEESGEGQDILGEGEGEGEGEGDDGGRGRELAVIESGGGQRGHQNRGTKEMQPEPKRTRHEGVPATTLAVPSHRGLAEASGGHGNKGSSLEERRLAGEHCSACGDGPLPIDKLQNRCTCGAPVCEHCTNSNQCWRCLQPVEIRKAQVAVESTICQLQAQKKDVVIRRVHEAAREIGRGRSPNMPRNHENKQRSSSRSARRTRGGSV